MAQLARASGIDPEAVEWLWRGRIPRGMICTIAGRPDQGKGLLSIHIAAEVAAAGGNVLHSAAEDSRALMTVPRYTAAIKAILADADTDEPDPKEVKAVLNRINFWDFVMPQQLNELAEIVEEEQIDLLVMDPFNAHLGKGVSRFSDSLRPVLGQLKAIAEKNRLAVVIIEHALKRVPKTGHPLDAIGGTSSGLPAASRTAYVFGVSPDDADKRVMAPAKFNIGEKPKAVQFEVDITDVPVVGVMPFLYLDDEEWELTAFDPMRLFSDNPKIKGSAIGRPDDKRAAAAEWLTTHLAVNGKMLSSAVQEDAKQNGMSVKTLRRAAEDMEIVKDPPGGGKNCTWDLPDDVKKMMGIAITTNGKPKRKKAQAKPQKATDVDIDTALAELLGGES